MVPKNSPQLLGSCRAYKEHALSFNTISNLKQRYNRELNQCIDKRPVLKYNIPNPSVFL